MMDSPPESPPHPKTIYELLREQKKAEMLKALEPVLCARRELDKTKRAKKPPRAPIDERKKQRLRWRLPPRRGLQGRKGKDFGHNGIAGDLQFSDMPSERDSSSEATKSNEEAIAEDVMESQEDSNDEDMQEPELLVDRRMKCRKVGGVSKSPVKEKFAQPSDASPPSSTPPYTSGWTWQPAQWMPERPLQPPPAWSGPQPPTPWSDSVVAAARFFCIDSLTLFGLEAENSANIGVNAP